MALGQSRIKNYFSDSMLAKSQKFQGIQITLQIFSALRMVSFLLRSTSILLCFFFLFSALPSSRLFFCPRGFFQDCVLRSFLSFFSCRIFVSKPSLLLTLLRFSFDVRLLSPLSECNRSVFEYPNSLLRKTNPQPKKSPEFKLSPN